MKKILIIIAILLFTAVSAYAFRMPLWYATVGSGGSPSVGGDSFLLLESGDYFLLESGDKLILE